MLAQELGVTAGDRMRLISPDGQRTPMGTSPRIKVYEVAYVFRVGRYDIDRIRVYMPFAEAQIYFNRTGVADQVHVVTDDPEEVDALAPAIAAAAGPESYQFTWKDNAGAFLRALKMEDNIMFVILSILVLIATLNITSGLVMLVKNKGRDIGILRTMGLTEGTVLRVFFLCGASIGVIGTALGVILGCLFALYIDPIFSHGELVRRRRRLGPVRAIHLGPAGAAGGGGRAVGRRALPDALLRRDDLPGAPGGPDEPGGGAAL